MTTNFSNHRDRLQYWISQIFLKFYISKVKPIPNPEISRSSRVLKAQINIQAKSRKS